MIKREGELPAVTTSSLCRRPSNFPLSDVSRGSDLLSLTLRFVLMNPLFQKFHSSGHILKQKKQTSKHLLYASRKSKRPHSLNCPKDLPEIYISDLDTPLYCRCILLIRNYLQMFFRSLDEFDRKKSFVSCCVVIKEVDAAIRGEFGI